MPHSGDRQLDRLGSRRSTELGDTLEILGDIQGHRGTFRGKKGMILDMRGHRGPSTEL